MLGYEKVNRRVAARPVRDPATVGEQLTDHRIAPSSKPRGKASRHRLIDLSALAAEPPGESIARENEIVRQLALDNDFAERPSTYCIAEQLQGLVDPAVIRRLA